MTSRSAAVGAETDPLRRARKLQRSWEHLLAEGALGPDLPPGATAGLRPTIVESWRRSLAARLDPTDLLAPIEADESEVLERWYEHPLASLTHVLTAQLRKVAEESRGVVVVTDASGLVLHRVGDEWLKERAAEMNLVEGARYSEAADGTNGIGTALAADRAFQVFAFEHFNERHHEWICSGAPVHDPVSGQTIGLLDLSSLWKFAHPRSLELVTTAARTIEQCLVEARRDRDARLRRRYSDFMTKRTDLLVDRDGYVLDGAEPADPSRFDIPEGGGEVVLGDGSVASAAPLGRGEAYLLRRRTTRRAKSAPPVRRLERAEERARELAAEQAALRQVATLVARESSPDRLFAVVAEQVARIFDVPHVRLTRYDRDGTVVVGGFSAGEDKPFPIGSRWALDSPGVTAAVRQTGRPARIEDYTLVTGKVADVIRGAGMRSAVASPIVVESGLWGAMVVLTPRHEPLPEDTEARLTDFTELLATAIANAESREARALLTEEQAALRRVATLVAQGVPSDALFSAVCDEVEALAGADASAVLRFETDGTVTVMGTHAVRGPVGAAGARLELDPDYIVGEVHRTGRAARFDTDDPAAPGMPEVVRAERVRSALASPIVVEGELWGAITTGSRERPLPAGMERRLADFTELVATAISNLQARAELAASRARIAAAAHDERRRVVRDLHDGAQQRLVHTVITLKLAQQALAEGAENGPLLVQEALAHAEQAMAEVRELAHGILPAVLTRGGLRAGIAALRSRSPVPVEVDVSADRLPAPVEATAYFVVAEALTNVAKHSSAGHAEVVARIEDGVLRVEVRDDGVGGASPDGTGLVGLADRLALLDGRLEVDSPPGGGTRLAAAIPLTQSDRSARA
jgi:signal transduction histidine kinase